MKKNGKYRFSLQFGMESKEDVTAGELLERLGNKKSKFVVAALNEYISRHPEQNGEVCALQSKIQSVPTELLELKIKEILFQQFKNGNTSEIVDERQEDDHEAMHQDIIGMLDDLELFN